MAIEDFVQSLLLGQAAKQEIAAADPYARGSNFFNNQLGGAVQQAAQNPTYSTKDKLIAGLVTGLIGGGFDGLSADYQGRAKSAYDQVLTDSMAGTPTVERPGVLDKSIFATAQNQGSVFRTMQALKQGDAERQLLGEIEKQRILKTDPSIIIGDAAAEGAKKLAGLKAENDFWGSQNSPVSEVGGDTSKVKTLADLNPASPQYKQLQAIMAEEDSARNELLTATKYPAIQKLQTTSTALSQLKNIKDLDTASSDIPFATLFIGGLDGSVVREGEYARVAGANPIFDNFRNQLEGALNGKSSLGVGIKKQMYNELVKTQKGLLAEALNQSKPRLDTALSRGANAARVMPFDAEMTFDEMPIEAAGNVITAPDGQEYQFVD